MGVQQLLVLQATATTRHCNVSAHLMSLGSAFTKLMLPQPEPGTQVLL
jgi:hypothetical protein